MGLVRVFLFTFLSVIFGLIPSAYAGWSGPQTVINLGWGRGIGQVAIEHGDTEDSFPHIFAVDEQGRVLLSDSGNVRLQIFSPDGSLSKIVSPIGWPADIFGWPLRLTLLSNSRVLIKRGDRYQIYNYDGSLSNEFKGVATHILEIIALPDDSIVVYKSDEKKFYQYSPTGQLIKTTTTRPLELGVVKEEVLDTGSYKTTVTYNDAVYTFKSDKQYERFSRDTSKNIYAILPGLVDKFSICGKLLGRLILPEDTVFKGGEVTDRERYVFIHDQYGEPVVDVHGHVYTWKRTPTKYSILKWTWKDDPNVPTGPDAPSGLSVTPSINGLYLTWTASPNDPGCVTGYEIARATSAGGVYSTIATVEKGVVKYNDTSAAVGTTYYYKVRAKAGNEYSPYTAEVSGKR